MQTIVVEGYEWDEKKNILNIQKHAISFSDAIRMFENPVFESPSKHQEKEKRTIAIGVLETKEIVVIHTRRGIRKRIISARRAKKNERKIYQTYLEFFHV